GKDSPTGRTPHRRLHGPTQVRYARPATAFCRRIRVLHTTCPERPSDGTGVDAVTSSHPATTPAGRRGGRPVRKPERRRMRRNKAEKRKRPCVEFGPYAADEATNITVAVWE